MGLEPGVMEDQTKPMKNGSVMARRSVTPNTARTRRGTDFGGSRDTQPLLLHVSLILKQEF
jgi:hypothetical protein